MSDIKDWSTTASSNNAAAPNGVPEGWAPSAVNAVVRENMRAVRAFYANIEWREFGDGTGTNDCHTVAYSSATTFATSAGDGDTTAVYHAGRRIRAVGSTTGTIYGTISSSTGDPTTVTVVWDSGSLSSEALTISLGPGVTGNPIFPTTTQGDIVVRGSSAPERLAIGTARQQLQVNSGATALEYADKTSWEVVQGLTFSGDTQILAYHDGIDNTGADFVDGWQYKFDFLDVFADASNRYIAAQYYEGSSYRTTDGYFLVGHVTTSAPAITPSYGAQPSVFIGARMDTSVARGANGSAILSNAGSTSLGTHMEAECGNFPAALSWSKGSFSTSVYTSGLSNAVKHIKIYPHNGGTFDGGKVVLSRRYLA